jgi:hypothetical protein
MMPFLRATATLLLAVTAAAAPSPRPKRGFVGDGCAAGATNCNAATLLTASSWHYSYNVDDKYYATTGRADGFVPMHWCISSNSAVVPPYVNRSILLGYNEPNNVRCARAAAGARARARAAHTCARLPP